MSPKAINVAKDGNRLRASSSGDTLGSLSGAASEQQMLTPQEISIRRKARRLLDQKKVALEEAVERRVCQRVYNRIWRHRASLDEVRDEKLRSRTAALALVGIGLQDLGINFDRQSSESDDIQIEDWISKARDGLLKMNDANFPLGKLQQLAAAHKSIVDLLTALHQSSVRIFRVRVSPSNLNIESRVMSWECSTSRCVSKLSIPPQTTKLTPNSSSSLRRTKSCLP